MSRDAVTYPNAHLPEPARSVADHALRVVDHVSAMLAYWNTEQVCVFANAAYLAWFGKSREQLIGSTMRDLLGPLYALNLPYIQAVLLGEMQVFERTIPNLDGNGARETLATYTPDIVDGEVRGFFVLVADVSRIKLLERELAASRTEAFTLRGLLPICMHCKKIRDGQGRWEALETYIRSRTEAEFSHGICTGCRRSIYPDVP